MPNGPPPMPLRLSDCTTATTKLYMSPCDMCPAYLARSHWTIASALLELQGPPGAGPGAGPGPGAGAAAVRNELIADHPVVVSPSLARERQKYVVPPVSSPSGA